MISHCIEKMCSLLIPQLRQLTDHQIWSTKTNGIMSRRAAPGVMLTCDRLPPLLVAAKSAAASTGPSGLWSCSFRVVRLETPRRSLPACPGDIAGTATVLTSVQSA